MKNAVFKRILVLLPVLVLMLMISAAAAYTDTAGHWAESAINEWSQRGIIQGADGYFRPNDSITRAEMATIITRLLKLEQAADNIYTDLPAGAWYEKAVLCCVKAGIMQGDGGGIIRPGDNVTRQEAMVMLGRAWHIEQSQTGVLGAFKDAANVAQWAKGYVESFVALGYVKGVGDNMLMPQGYINRASVVTILSNAIGAYVRINGELVDMNSAGQGIVLVCAKNVYLGGSAEGTVLVTGIADTVTVSGIVRDMKVAADGVVVDMQNGIIIDIEFLADNGMMILRRGASVSNIQGEHLLFDQSALESGAPTPPNMPDDGGVPSTPTPPNDGVTTPEIPVRPF